MATLSAEAIGNNIYLLTEILLRLPVKSLVRSKCVSKQWLSLISDPQFCLSHNRHHHSPYPTPTALLVNYRCSDPEFIPPREFNIIPLKHDTVCRFPSVNYLNTPGTQILQSCNGLLLCCSWYYVTQSIELLKRVIRCFIWNPITKQFKNLACPNPEFLDSAFNFRLALDPLTSIHYKIIAFLPVKSQRQVNEQEQRQIYIYSSETDSWSPTEIICTPPMSASGGLPTVFCNGAIHWISWDVDLLYFDVNRERLNTMPLPMSSYHIEHFNESRDHMQHIKYFGESRGHLHLIVTDGFLGLIFNVLEMATYYSGWYVRYHVNLDAMITVCPKLFYHGEEKYKNSVYVFSVIRAEKEEESMVVVSLNDRAISYNIRDGTLELLFDFESKSKVGYAKCLFRMIEAYQFFETLSCV